MPRWAAFSSAATFHPAHLHATLTPLGAACALDAGVRRVLWHAEHTQPPSNRFADSQLSTQCNPEPQSAIPAPRLSCWKLLFPTGAHSFTPLRQHTATNCRPFSRRLPFLLMPPPLQSIVQQRLLSRGQVPSTRRSLRRHHQKPFLGLNHFKLAPPHRSSARCYHGFTTRWQAACQTRLRIQHIVGPASKCGTQQTQAFVDMLPTMATTRKRQSHSLAASQEHSRWLHAGSIAFCLSVILSPRDRAMP